MAIPRKPLIGALLAFAGSLRFPLLFAITTALFLLDLVIPDAVPLADEILLGLGALLLARWKKRRDDDGVVEIEAS